MSIIPAGESSLLALAWIPRWAVVAAGAFAMFQAGLTAMAGMFLWLYRRDPSRIDALPEVGWPWAANLALWTFIGMFLTVQAYRGHHKAPQPDEGGPKGV